MISIRVLVLFCASFFRDDARTGIAAISLVTQGGYTGYGGYPARADSRQQSLNTPANTDGRVNHNYFLNRRVEQTAGNDLPTPATTTTRGASQSLYQTREGHFSNSGGSGLQNAGTDSPATPFGSSGTSQSVYQSRGSHFSGGGGNDGGFGSTAARSSSVNGGSGGVFHNQQASSNFANYQVTLQGTLLTNPQQQQHGSGTGYGGTSSFFAHTPFFYEYDVPSSTAHIPVTLPGVGLGTGTRATGYDAHELFGALEEVVAVTDRALLEEVASDATGQTHCLDIPRCSYIPVRKGCDGHETRRTIDGTCNNVQHPQWGSAFQPFKRYLPAAYHDGSGSPRKSSVEKDTEGKPLPLPSARLVSRTVHLVKEETSLVSGLLMQFGQFVDHDITGTSGVTGESGAIICCGEKREEHEACMPIPIPPGDTHFTDSTCINFVRSLPAVDKANTTLTPREQRNEVTSYLDASVVYGSTADQLNKLRTFQQGLLLCSEGEMLPLEVGGCAAEDGLCFFSGDTRVNEIPGLGALHLVFHRHHNRLARALLGLVPTLDVSVSPDVLDEALFQTARAILAAQLQHVVYTEWLPLVLGPFAVTHYGLDEDESSHSYDPERNPQIANVFASAAFRFGHSLVPVSYMWGHEHIPLHRAFSNPKWVREDVDKVLKGLLQVHAQTLDPFFVDGLRNRLFEPAPRKGLDLIALNIQRGRDHGLPPYNAWRETCGLPRVSAFNDSALGLAGPSLREVYMNVDDIDLFSGAMSEPALTGGLVGPTLACLIGKQFADLKHSDRFFYLSRGKEGLSQGQLHIIKQTTMTGLLCSNTETLTSVQQNPFLPTSEQNPPVMCNQFRQRLTLQPWKQHLINLIYELSGSA